MEERMSHNLYNVVSTLECPSLFVVCENDSPGRNDSILNFFKKVPSGLKRYIEVKNAPHTIREKSQLEQLSASIENFVHLVGSIRSGPTHTGSVR
jgi:esterase/lipase